MDEFLVSPSYFAYLRVTASRAYPVRALFSWASTRAAYVRCLPHANATLMLYHNALSLSVRLLNVFPFCPFSCATSKTHALRWLHLPTPSLPATSSLSFSVFPITYSRLLCLASYFHFISLLSLGFCGISLRLRPSLGNIRKFFVLLFRG